MNITTINKTESWWSIELSVRTSNILNALGFNTIEDVLLNCIENGKYTGLKGNVKGVKGANINYELAQKLHEYGFVEDIEHVKKRIPKTCLLIPNEKEMIKIREHCTVSLSTLLIDLDFKDVELEDLCEALIREDCKFERSNLTVADYIRGYIRVSISGKFIFRTWGHDSRLRHYFDAPVERRKKIDMKINSIKKRLIDWGVLQSNQKDESIKLSFYDCLREYYEQKPLANEYKLLNSLVAGHSLSEDNVITQRLQIVENMARKVNSILSVEDFLKSRPDLPKLENLPKHVRKQLDHLQKDIDRIKAHFSTKSMESYKKRILDDNEPHFTSNYGLPYDHWISINIRAIHWTFKSLEQISSLDTPKQ